MPHGLQETALQPHMHRKALLGTIVGCNDCRWAGERIEVFKIALEGSWWRGHVRGV
jgi:hypothetical protein